MNESKTMAIIKLLPALMYVFPEIKNAFYRIDQDTKEEYVTVTWSSIEYDNEFGKTLHEGMFHICVTCDSIAAMFDDVWKECKRRFA